MLGSWSLLTAHLQLRPYQLGWIASVLVHAGVCARAGVAGAAAAPSIARVSTGPDIGRLGNVYRSSWGREKQKPPPKGRDMRQRWACITHRQLGGPCCGLWASAHPVLAAQREGPQHSPQPILCLVLYRLSPLLNRRAPLWRFISQSLPGILRAGATTQKDAGAAAGPGDVLCSCRGCYAERGGGGREKDLEGREMQAVVASWRRLRGVSSQGMRWMSASLQPCLVLVNWC